MSNDQVMLRLDGTLHVVAGDAGLLARRRHGTGIRIGQRDLRFAAAVHAPLNGSQGAGFLLVVGQLLFRSR